MPKPVMPALHKAAKTQTASKDSALKKAKKSLFGFLSKKEEKTNISLSVQEQKEEHEHIAKQILSKKPEKKKSILGSQFAKKIQEKTTEVQKASDGFLQKFTLGNTKTEKEKFDNSIKNIEEESIVSVSLGEVISSDKKEAETQDDAMIITKEEISAEESSQENIEPSFQKPKVISEENILLEEKEENETEKPKETENREEKEAEKSEEAADTEMSKKKTDIPQEEEKEIPEIKENINISLENEGETPEEGGLSFANGIVEEDDIPVPSFVEKETAEGKENINISLETEEKTSEINPPEGEIQHDETEKEKQLSPLAAGIIMEEEEEIADPTKKPNTLVTGVLQEIEKAEEETPDEADGLSLSEKLKKKGISDVSRKKGGRLVAAARFLFLFSFAVPFCAWMIFQAVIVENSGLSEAISAKNYGTELSKLKDSEEKSQMRMNTIKKDIGAMQQDINGIRNEKVLTEISDNRIDFLEIMLRINTITLQSLELTPEVNRVINMLVFNSYAASIDKDGNASVNISGTVRDPKRMSFTKLTTLMETINQDKSFAGANIRSFSKSDDSEGGAKSSFTFNLAYDKDPDDGSEVAKK